VLDPALDPAEVPAYQRLVSDLALDPATGDLDLQGGAARLCEGAEAVAQLWAFHITMFRGEWFNDRSLGIDYQHDILEKGVSPAVVRAIFATATRAVPGVADVRDLRLALDRTTRTLTVTAEALLSTGQDASLGLSETIGGSS
jgi:hypothetical protein